MTGQIPYTHQHTSTVCNKRPNPSVSIIIPSYRDSPALQKCLDALSIQTFPLSDFEIIVVNNAPDHPLKIQYPHSNLIITQEKKPGSYAARNKGISLAKGQILGFCDSDCIPAANWISSATKALSDNPSTSRTAGKIDLTFQIPEQPSIFELYESVFAFRQQEYVRDGGSVTANMFAYKYVFDQVGLFDHNLISGGDLVWGKQAQQRGYTIAYSDNVVVAHPARHSFHQLSKKAKRVISGYIELKQAGFKNNPFSAVLHGLIMLKPPIKSAFMIAQSKDLPSWKKLIIYGVDYLLKIIQLYEFMIIQFKGKPLR